ncbi:MAG: hypothetical protein P4M13_04665 [Alphaproteobacteria bacterium]|nr:hypothetical protein [Alphaproteobacteria bacterium]
MRCPLYAAVGFFLAAALTPLPSQATGNVLLPSSPSSGDGASFPNLGLGVVEPSPKQGNPAAEPQPSAEAPAPTAASTASQSAPRETAVEQPSAPISLTRVQPLVQTDNRLPYKQTIVIGDKSMFGSQDVQKIGDKLGLTRDQIASSCYLGVEGLLQTDKGEYLITNAAPAPATINYDGVIKDYLISGSALCAGSNGQAIISLEPANCPPPKSLATKLTITYDGSGTSQCVYD